MPVQPDRPAEVELLALLLKPAWVPNMYPGPDPAPEHARDHLPRRVQDWPYFLALVDHHRIAPLVARSLQRMPGLEVPTEVRNNLDRAATANAHAAFRYLGELQRLLKLLASAGIHASVFKGVPLSVEAYGDIALRDVGDIDLLIAEQDAERVDALLQQSGMHRQEPAARLTRKRRAFYQAHFKDYTYAPHGAGFELDLHWRLIRDSSIASALFPVSSSGTASRAFTGQSRTLGSMEIEVLAPEQTLLYLTLHGALEGWARWKTLVDVAALWSKATSASHVDILSWAERTETSPFLHAALSLAGEWLGLPVEPSVSVQAARCARTRYILGYSRRRMQERGMLEQAWMPSPAGNSSFGMRKHEATLFPSLRSRVELAKRILFRPRMWESVNLPDGLFFLYPCINVAEWLAFQAKRKSRPSSL